jgi:hypothetical protein
MADGKGQIRDRAKNLHARPCLTALRNLGYSAPGPLGIVRLISQYFIAGMMPESANPVQQSLTVVEIRPLKGDSVTRARGVGTILAASMK